MRSPWERVLSCYLEKVAAPNPMPSPWERVLSCYLEKVAAPNPMPSPWERVLSCYLEKVSRILTLCLALGSVCSLAT